MTDIPNLAGVATADLVEKIGAGSFSASYINWSRTVNLLRAHAPGWQAELVPNAEGSVLHRAPVGGYLLIRFRHVDGTVTPEVPQAVMDSRNNAVQFDKITARDLTDTHRRGVCMAAAFTFGLAYELWAKIALESGYAEANQEPEKPTAKVTPLDGAWDAMDAESQAFLLKVAAEVAGYFRNDPPMADEAWDYIVSQQLGSEEKNALWTRFDSKVRSALKKAAANKKEAA